MSGRRRTLAAASLALALGACSSEQRLLLDVHHLPSGKVALADVAAAHRKDLAIEGAHGVAYRRYWVDEGSGTIFCLVEAPSAEAANTVHREAHGLVADEIHEVSQG